jgi:hypothetical protein
LYSDGARTPTAARIGDIDATWVLPGHSPAWDGGVTEAIRLTREAAAR